MTLDHSKSGIVIRRQSGLPVYLQLVDQLRYLVGAGRFRVGEYLPTTRQLADELGINFNTVNRAYRQLQRDGLISSTPGKGAVVLRAIRSGDAAPTPLGAASSVASGEEIDAILSAALERTLAAGLAPNEVERRVAALLAALAERVPPAARVELFAGRPWRSERLAAQLSALSGIDVSVYAGVTDPGLDSSPADGAPRAAAERLLVLPQYGLWRPQVSGAEHPPMLHLPVLPARAAIQAVLGLEPGAALCALAADEGVARWLCDTSTALLAGGSSAHREVVADASEYTPRAGEWVVAEAGMPGLDAAAERAPSRVISVEVTFPTTATEDLREALRSFR